MRMLVHAKLPNEPFHTLLRKGKVGDLLKRIVDDLKPEAVYFTEYSGHRSAVLIVDVADPSKVPAIAEPWFITFDAEVRFHVVMTPDDLGRADLDGVSRKWL